MRTRSAVTARHGVIATSQPLASQAGLEVMRNGGNAIDAVVTAAAVLTVVEPHSVNLGGDLFALLWSAQERELVGLNASGRSGSLATRDTLVARGHVEMPATGPETITVPGTLSGWSILLERFGTLSLADALAPAIALAQDGFAVTATIAFEWAAHGTAIQDAGFRATFLPKGRAPVAGETFRNQDYARTLSAIAAGGPALLYGGELGQRVVEGITSLGGFLTLDDLVEHRAEWVSPLSISCGHGRRLWELPPNGQGVVALEMLRILEAFDLRSMGHNSARYLHHLIEAKKLAFADIEKYVGDPAYMKERPERFISDEWISARRLEFDPSHAAERVEPGLSATAGDTVYLTAADEQGNMVSLINSLYSAFGSGVVVPGTGFPLQNRGSGFTLRPGLPNTIGPRKRPRHTIIPAFVTRDGEPWMSFGVMGGAMQPQGHVQVLLNMLLFGMDPQQAIEAPRFRHMAGREVWLEEGIPESVCEELRRMGHQVERQPTGAPQQFGGGQVIVKTAPGYRAGSDPRKDGSAAGY